MTDLLLTTVRTRQKGAGFLAMRIHNKEDDHVTAIYLHEDEALAHGPVLSIKIEIEFN